MAKKESNFITMVVSLFLVTLIASSALAFVYEMTKGPIAEAKRLKKANAIREVVPDFDNDPGSEMRKQATERDTLYYYLAMKGDQISGIAVETYTYEGFSGLIKLMVGFLPDGSIYKIAVLEHQETPGLGDKMENQKSIDKTSGQSWSSQFDGLNPGSLLLKVRQDNGEVDAISAATISSRAYCDAVQRAYDGLHTVLAEQETETENSIDNEPVE